MNAGTPGFVGSLVDFRPQRGTRLLSATVALRHRDLDAFHRAIGAPASGVNPEIEPDFCPAVALLPAIHPRHPNGHDEALYDAALAALEALIEDGNVRIDPRRTQRTMRLGSALLRLPFHMDDSRPCRA